MASAFGVAPVRGEPTWIGKAWFGRKVWVIKTYADHLFSFSEYTKTYFATRDQGKTWRPFQMPQDVENGLLGMDASGKPCCRWPNGTERR